MPSASHSPSADANAGSATTRSGSARKRPRLSGFAPSTMRHGVAEADQAMLLDVDAVAVLVADGVPQSSHRSGRWFGGSGAELRQRQAHLGRLVAHRQERRDHLDPFEVRHCGQERRDHLVATGCAAASGRSRGVGDADRARRRRDARGAHRRPGSPPPSVEEGVAQRRSTRLRTSVGCRPWRARTSPTSGSDAHARRRPRHRQLRGAVAPASSSAVVCSSTAAASSDSPAARASGESRRARRGRRRPAPRGRDSVVHVVAVLHQMPPPNAAGVCTRSSSLPLPRYMWTPHGRHGSKLRTARMMSMPLNRSGGFSSKIGVFCTASS